MVWRIPTYRSVKRSRHAYNRIVASRVVTLGVLVATMTSLSPVAVPQAAAASSDVRVSDTTLVLKKGSYGPITSLTNKGYAVLDIGAAADTAQKTLKPCTTAVDKAPSLKWGADYCFTPSSKWKFQGITGSAVSGSGENNILIASQHSKGDKRARIVVMNLATKKYQTIELVRPCNNAAGYCKLAAPKKCDNTHAGGVAWRKNNLFVADTDCMIVFDTTKIFRLTSGTLVMPTTYYWSRSQNTLTLSNVSIDTTSPIPQLVASEYNKADRSGDCKKAYIGRWDLAANGEMVADSDNIDRATADAVLTTKAVCEIQGIASYKGVYLMNSSRGYSEYMYRLDTRGNLSNKKYLMPRHASQNIYIDTNARMVWSLTELPASDGQVRVFSFTLPSILN